MNQGIRTKLQITVDLRLQEPISRVVSKHDNEREQAAN